jgi:hypothetical protein
MDYVALLNQLDRKLSNQIDGLQKKQEQLLEQKKSLLETKQKIDGFLSDAHEMKRLLNFDPELINSVSVELKKIFNSQNQLNRSTENIHQPTDLQSNLTSQPEANYSKSAPKAQPQSSRTPPPPESNSEENLSLEPDLDLDLEPQVIIDDQEQEPIRIFKFVDADGKDTSF